jgi:hypothetical protein
MPPSPHRAVAGPHRPRAPPPAPELACVGGLADGGARGEPRVELVASSRIGAAAAGFFLFSLFFIFQEFFYVFVFLF